ncbi:MAG: hypothetical protein FJ029_00850, partial [Actinobacteria bacterium]|nr:hypothetical protein [Actinomycetota bacterium]
MYSVLEPLGQAVSVAGQPGALLAGTAGGAVAGGLLALAAALAFVRSTAAWVAGAVALVATVAIWALVAGSVALASTQRAEGAPGHLGPALRGAWHRLPALVAVALPAVAVLGALAAVEVVAFAAMGPPESVVQFDRPYAVIAVVFTLLLLANTAAFALVNVTLWAVTPFVIVDGVSPAVALARARAG